MSIVGSQPESGMRLSLERRGGGPLWTYEGHIATSEGIIATSVTVLGDHVEIAPGLSPDLAERVRLLVKSVVRAARTTRTTRTTEDGPPPRRIERWRSAT